MIDHLPVSDLILKLYAFDIFLFGLPPLKRPKWFPFYARAMERTKNLSIIDRIVKIFRYYSLNHLTAALAGMFLCCFFLY
jgi:hypothetical protein